MERQTGSFTATGDGGRQYTVLIFTPLIGAGARCEPHAASGGLLRLRTSDGLTVSPLQKGEYEVVQTGEVLRSDSPDAP